MTPFDVFDMIVLKHLIYEELLLIIVVIPEK